LEEEVSYTQAAAGGNHTILLRSDGRTVACGDDSYGQCTIPALAAGLAYTQAAAGDNHTVLLRSDGNVEACGDNEHGQCNVPALEAGMAYAQVAAGSKHTVLLRSDGRAVTCGDNMYGQCAIPALEAGLAYTQATAGGSHTVLLRSDGTAVACGSNKYGQSRFSYVRSSEASFFNVVPHFEPNPGLQPLVVKLLLQASFDGKVLCVSMLSGAEVCKIEAAPTDRLTDVQSKLRREMPRLNVDIVLPSCAVLGDLIRREPSVFLEHCLAA
jgi:hypothetical protein